MDTISTFFGPLAFLLLLGLIAGHLHSISYRHTSSIGFLLEIIYEFIEAPLQRTGLKDRILWSNAFLFFIFIIFCNLLDALPHTIASSIFIPSFNINVCLAMSLTQVLLILYSGIKQRGSVVKFLYHLTTHPFQGPYLLVFLPNLIFGIVENMLQPLTLGIRLFVNMLTGSIIQQILIGTSLGVYLFFGTVWTIVHTILLTLQAYIFITLSLTYIEQQAK